MGIKFLCPNGHRLNVKAFLAGKRAKCPHCGAKVRVPRSSNGADERGDYTAHAAVPAGVPARRGTIVPGGAAEAGAAGPSHWFVRLPSGGQYGPAADATVADWIREGRISADAWVWRDGWADWQPAHEVLTHLGLGTSSGEDIFEPPSGLEAAPVAVASSAHIHRRKQDRTVLWISLLALATLILLAILIWILSRTG